MKQLLKIGVLCWLFFAQFAFQVQSQIDENKPLLFTDRGFCVSGDTIWLMYKVPVSIPTENIVVRFQLETAGGSEIGSIATASAKGWAGGFLPVPDSLSSGHYFITAFLLNQSVNQVFPITKSLLVYNRFDEDITQLQICSSTETSLSENKVGDIKIKTDKEIYNQREKVELSFDLPAEIEIAEAVVRATLIDSLEKKIAPGYSFDYKFANAPEPGFIEENGFLITGKVKAVNGKIQPGVLVVISLPASGNYFDYCIADSSGTFHFFLKRAFGETDAIFQVFSGTEDRYQIELENATLQRTGRLLTEPLLLSPFQTSFIRNALSSSFANHIFYPGSVVNQRFFSMEAPDSIPFYGAPTLRIRPEEYFDLPDFREISRELLHGFQYRIRNEKIVFRMLNRTQSEFFKEEPLRLINGIPVFDNQLFVALKSTEIEYIDLVLHERVYGDLILNGVIEVSLKDKSDAWIGNQPNLFRRNITFLQPPGKTAVCKRVAKNSEPDTRQVFLWEKIEGNPGVISIDLSDRKGIAEISVEGFTTGKKYFRTTKTIEIK